MEIKIGRRPKTARNNKIMEYVAKGYTYQAIAGIFHISKARVAFIVKRELGKIKNSTLTIE